MSFRAGFFNAGSAILDENQQYIKTKRAKDRDFLMTYGVQAVTKAQEKVNNAVTTAMQLENFGLEKKHINYVVETSGPLGLAELYSKIEPVHSAGRLTPNVLNDLMEKTKDYVSVNPDMTYEDMIKRTFGLYSANATDDPAENEKIGFWSALGFDSRAADSALDEVYIDDFTGRDIKRIAGTPSPGLKAPLGMDFTTLPKIYSATEYSRIAINAKERMLDEAEAYIITLDPKNLPEEVPIAKYNLINKAITAKKYDILLREVPTVQQFLRDYDKTSRGGLSSNDTFRAGLRGVDEFFGNTATSIDPAASNLINDTTNTIYTRDFKEMIRQYPNLVGTIKLEDLKTYETDAEATASGDPVYILNGQIEAKKSLIKNIKPVDPDGTEVVPADDTEKTKAMDFSSAVGLGPPVANSGRNDGTEVSVPIRDFNENPPDLTMVKIANDLNVGDLFPGSQVDPPILGRPNIAVRTLKGMADILEQPTVDLADSLRGPVLKIADVIEKPVKAINKSLTNYMEPLAAAIKQGRNGTSQDVSLGDIFGEWFSNTFPNFSLPENPLETVNYAAGVIRDEIQRDVPTVLPTAIELIPGELPMTLLMYGALDTVMKEGRTFNDIEVAKRWIEEFLEKEEDFLIKSGMANYDTGEYPNKATIDIMARTLLTQTTIRGGGD